MATESGSGEFEPPDPRTGWKRTLAIGIHCATLINRLQASGRDVEQARAQNRVVDIHVVRAAIAAVVQGYKRWAADLGNAPIDVERDREIIREIAYPIPVRTGQDGVPIAELSLNADMPLGAANGMSHIGVLAGAGFAMFAEGFSVPQSVRLR